MKNSSGARFFLYDRAKIVGLCITLTVLFCTVPPTYAISFYEESTVYSGGDNGYAAYRLPVLIVEDDGTLLSFADGRVYSAADTGNKIDAVLKRSTDGGDTWENLQVLGTASGTYSKVGNCTAVYDSTTDTTHLVYLEDLTHAYQISTTDGGVTFSNPVEITSVYDQFGFDWSYFATGHVHGIQLENGTESGRLMLPIWMSDHPRSQDSLATFAAGVIYSDDHGQTWTAGGLVDSDKKLNESTIFEATDGSICINSRAASGDGYRVVSWSDDAGESFGSPENDLELPDVVCQSTTLTTQDNQGVPVTLFCGPGGPARSNLTIRVSYDNGQTWPISKVVAPNYSGYSDIGVNADGTIFVTYETSPENTVGDINLLRFNMEWLLTPLNSTSGEGGRLYCSFQHLTEGAIGGNYSGTYFSDASGGGYQGQVTGDVTVMTDPTRGNVAKLGEDSLVDFGDVLDPGDSSYSVSLWFKPDAWSGTQYLAKKGNTYSSDDGWSIFLARDDTLFVRGNFGEDDDARLGVSIADISDDQWHHVVLVIDQETGLWQAYLDGAGSGSSGNENGWITGEGGGITQLFPTGSSFDCDNTLQLANGYQGLLDDFAIFDWALTEEEVLALFEDGVSPNDMISPNDPIPGDANGDGRVDGSDVTILAGSWQIQSDATWEMGDFNGDGKVDGSDVTILAGNWQYGTTSATTTVPEPSIFVLFLSMLAITLKKNRRIILS